ncbi:unnamed protein product, partial [Arabidopsis halleri]
NSSHNTPPAEASPRFPLDAPSVLSLNHPVCGAVQPTITSTRFPRGLEALNFKSAIVTSFAFSFTNFVLSRHLPLLPNTSSHRHFQAHQTPIAKTVAHVLSCISLSSPKFPYTHSSRV